MNRLNRRKERLLNEIAERVTQKLLKEEAAVRGYIGAFESDPEAADLEIQVFEELDKWYEHASDLTATELVDMIQELVDIVYPGRESDSFYHRILQMLEGYAEGTSNATPQRIDYEVHGWLSTYE